MKVRIEDSGLKTHGLRFMSRVYSLAAIVLLTVLSGCTASREAVREDAAAVLYAEGVKLYRNGDYNEAIDKFKKIIEDYPFDSFVEDAQLLLSDAYYESAQYGDAASYYTNFVALHPGHPNAPYAQFQKGMSYLREVLSIDRDQSNTQKAVIAFDELVSLYPKSLYVDKAGEISIFLKKRLAEREFYIGNFYFKNKKYKGALVRFAEVLKKYPDAGMSDKVLYYIGRSYLGLGEKDLARDAFFTLIKNFPGSSFAENAEKLLNNNSEG